jgi:hypothetical protein
MKITTIVDADYLIPLLNFTAPANYTHILNLKERLSPVCFVEKKFILSGTKKKNNGNMNEAQKELVKPVIFTSNKRKQNEHSRRNRQNIQILSPRLQTNDSYDYRCSV